MQARSTLIALDRQDFPFKKEAGGPQSRTLTLTSLHVSKDSTLLLGYSGPSSTSSTSLEPCLTSSKPPHYTSFTHTRLCSSSDCPRPSSKLLDSVGNDVASYDVLPGRSPDTALRCTTKAMGAGGVEDSHHGVHGRQRRLVLGARSRSPMIRVDPERALRTGHAVCESPAESWTDTPGKLRGLDRSVAGCHALTRTRYLLLAVESCSLRQAC